MFRICLTNLSKSVRLASQLKTISLPAIRVTRITSFEYTSLIGRKHYSTEKPIENEDKEKFIPLYQLTQIRIFAALMIMKNYQYLATIVAIPLSAVLEMTSLAAEGTFSSVLVGGLSLTLFFTCVSLQIRNIIGIIYISEDGTKLKVSYVNFKGRRIDAVVPLEEWPMLSEVPQTPLSFFYVSIACKSIDRNLKFFPRYGNILDIDKFKLYLGSL